MAALAHAQSVEIYSEFQRFDPFGNVVPADRGWKSREILSPAVGRNGHASFHIVVTVPHNDNYLLYVATNPLNACTVSVFREHFVKTRDGWTPDTLVELTRLPDFGVVPDPRDGVEGQNTRIYLLDLWIPPNSPVARFRVEVQLKMADWTIRPMEVRIVEATYPTIPEGGQTVELPSPEAGADAAAYAALRDYWNGLPLAVGPKPLTVRGVIRRNAVQDIALARTLDVSPAALMERTFQLIPVNSVYQPRPFGAEWYLRLRDYLLGQRK